MATKQKKCQGCKDQHRLHIRLPKPEARQDDVDEVIVVRGGRRKSYLWLGSNGMFVGSISGARLRKIAEAVSKETNAN